jgi:hypothetical protein
MNDAAPVVRRPRGVPLFYQIAVRLIVCSAIAAASSLKAWSPYYLPCSM